MALIDNVPTQACVDYCYEARAISEDDFLDFMINALSDSSSTPLADLTGAEIRTAIEAAICAMQTVPNSPIPVEQKRGIFLALWASL